MKEKVLRKLLIKNMPEVHWQPIETGGTARGVPDLNGCYLSREIWIELKQGKPRLSAFQMNWIRKRDNAGGRVWVVSIWNRQLFGWYGGLLQSRFFVQFLKDIKWATLRDELFQDGL